MGARAGTNRAKQAQVAQGDPQAQATVQAAPATVAEPRGRSITR